MYRVCIISCGMIANSAHIPAYRHFADDFDLVGVCDINEKAARDTAERYAIPNWYTDAEEMLNALQPDIVSVCVPNCFHKAYTKLALKCGAHVLCEKPLAVTKADAMDLFETAKNNGKLLMACQSMRFTPDRLAARRFIDEGGMDSIYYAELSRVRRRGIPTWGTFHMKKISCGGAFIDIGVHMLDALVWLMGNPKVRSVRAVTQQNHKGELGSLKGSGALTGKVDNARAFRPDEMDVEDFSCGVIMFENDAFVTFKVAWAANIPESSDILLVSKKAGLDIPTGKILYGETGEACLETDACPYDTPFPGHIYLADNLRKILKGEAEPIVKPEETINVSAIIELMYKSAELGRETYAEELRS